MILPEFRLSLSGKQSDENPDTSRLSNVPSELPYLRSKQVFLGSSDVRYGSEAEVAAARAWPRSAPAPRPTSTGTDNQLSRHPYHLAGCNKLIENSQDACLFLLVIL